jgi:hypothetical protein
MNKKNWFLVNRTDMYRESEGLLRLKCNSHANSQRASVNAAHPACWSRLLARTEMAIPWNSHPSYNSLSAKLRY